MTVSSFSSPEAACSKFNLDSDLNRVTAEGSLITSTSKPSLQPRLNSPSLYFRSPVEPAPSPQVTPVNTFLSNSLVTDLEGLSLSDTVLSPAVSLLTFFWWVFWHLSFAVAVMLVKHGKGEYFPQVIGQSGAQLDLPGLQMMDYFIWNDYNLNI